MSEKQDAERWRKLMASEFMQVMGHNDDLTDIAVRFWAHEPRGHPVTHRDQSYSREAFSAFVDALPRQRENRR